MLEKQLVVFVVDDEQVIVCRSRELIHNHGRIYVKRGEWVHDNSKDARKIESVFAALAAQ